MNIFIINGFEVKINDKFFIDYPTIDLKNTNLFSLLVNYDLKSYLIGNIKNLRIK